MTHCRVCGVLDDVGEEVICEDCADKLSEHDEKIAEIAKIAKKERERINDELDYIRHVESKDEFFVTVYLMDVRKIVRGES